MIRVGDIVQVSRVDAHYEEYGVVVALNGDDARVQAPTGVYDVPVEFLLTDKTTTSLWAPPAEVVALAGMPSAQRRAA